MYILIALFFSASNSGFIVDSKMQEFNTYATCVAAKQAIEQSTPYNNARTVTCVAK